MRLIRELKDRADILLCIYAGDIERKKIRADFGITYDADAMKLIDDLRGWGIDVCAVIITRFDHQPAATLFKNKLERRSIRVFTHRFTKGYPTDVESIVSDEGYGANEYVETKKPLVIVTGPGPGSGKLATCLSQLYHEHRRGVNAGYAKFETFPIWNIPLNHPVNIAYEAATADIRDFNLIDPFHMEAYGKTAVNYNRDVEVFPVVKRILSRITGHNSPYQSPTDMGVNKAGFAIVDDDATREAAKQEILRRCFRYRCEYAMGVADKETVQRVELFLTDLDVQLGDRVVVAPSWEAARKAQEQNKGNEGIYCGAAIELRDGTIVTGNNSPSHACRVKRGSACHQTPGRHPRKAGTAAGSNHQLRAESEDEYSEREIRQPRPGGNSDRAEHQRGNESRGADVHGKIDGAAKLRNPHDPHPYGRRRSGPAPTRRQPHQ